MFQRNFSISSSFFFCLTTIGDDLLRWGAPQRVWVNFSVGFSRKNCKLLTR